MAIIKCKMCGGDLILTEGQSVAECDSCGRLQTIPNLDDEKKLIQFERAERLRRQCEFDKAAGIYETIVADFRQEAEAYWGLVLCKFGIEYVDDPATGKKIPTCHRSSFDSIMDDSDFEQALENADAVARKVYRDEAKAIEEIRKGIIAVSANEEPYDIFICYKETAESGDRTLDSVLAQDVYDALTDKGYRVFFSRITLEDKLGMEYEPYIFAALNSAKIMLAFGTDYEYFNAVWVKNEWSRFLKLMAKDKDKHLIPCFKGIDAYDMPKEFARLQAQDLGKVGAIQDLLRGIEKLLPKQQNTVVIQERVVQERVVRAYAGNPGVSTINSMLDRGNLALEDENWSGANQFFESVLNSDPRNADAYLGIFLAFAHCRNLDSFVQKRINRYAAEMPIENLVLPVNTAYIDKAVQKFTVPGIVTEKEIRALYEYHQEYPSEVTARKKKHAEEDAYWADHKRYARALQFATGAMAEQLERAKKDVFDFLGQRMELAQQAEAAAKAEAQSKYDEYLIQADQKAKLLYDAAVQQRQLRYRQLVQVANSSQDARELLDAADTLASFRDYEDSCQLVERCNKRANEIIELRKSQLPLVKNMLGAGFDDSFALKSNGRVITTSTENKWTALDNWREIAAISVSVHYTVGLKADGTVVAVGDNSSGQCNVSSWTGIAAIAAGRYHTVGLKADGTVVSTQYILNWGPESSEDFGQTNVSSWTGITAIAAGEYHTVGLKADGTVIVTEYINNRPIKAYRYEEILREKNCNNYGQSDTSEWKDIVAVAASRDATFGLKADGTVVCTSNRYKVAQWRDIVAIDASWFSHVVGLKADGTVVAEGYNSAGRCNVSGWRNIVAISAGNNHTLGLKADGTVVATEFIEDPKFKMTRHKGQCNVSGWKLFESIDMLEEELEAEKQKWEEQKAEKRKREVIQARRAAGRCQHCGGTLKGLFSKKCVDCGKQKDY